MLSGIVVFACAHAALLVASKKRYYLRAPPTDSTIFYSDPRSAEAAAEADAELSEPAPVVPPAPTTVPFMFPHLHVQKVGKTNQVNAIKCKELQERIGALKCSLVTYISGYPEGCECRMTKKCPPVPSDMGFTGLSPSDTVNFPQMGDISVSLCMYWQMRAPIDNSAADAKAKSDSVVRATKLVDDAVAAASANAAVIGNALWTVTPTPFPRVS
eukprot:GEMP01063347.1.p1 GENE.GEMP01063347.1~~GEMP01063347.1.p1  ORF type:complete len:248 (+),score=45.94 GEMP01063347.1:104-745(+)